MPDTRPAARPPDQESADLRVRRRADRKMARKVDWYSPPQLVRTGFQALLSSLLGAQVDTRVLRVAGEDDESIFDCYREQESATFDYAADTGDGFDATYALAYLLSAREIEVATERPDWWGRSRGGRVHSARADFAALGGDEVYPTASVQAYERRLVKPFEAAALQHGYPGDFFTAPGWTFEDEQPLQEHERRLFLLPGNHDWYDSLNSFTRRFCFERRVGAFKTAQRRSYFVIELPHRWELWAADVQLTGGMDAPQFRFFRRRAATLTAESKVIICLAEPPLVYGHREIPEKKKGAPLRLLQELIWERGAVVPLVLAGDTHNYQRYDEKHDADRGDDFRRMSIVSGGGGAFLHPTHRLDRHRYEDEDPASPQTEPAEAKGKASEAESSDRSKHRGFALRNRYPSGGRSFWLSLKLFLFPLLHFRMWILLGVVSAAALSRLSLSLLLSLPLLVVTVLATFLLRTTGKPPNWRFAGAQLVHVPAQILTAQAALGWSRSFGEWVTATLAPATGLWHSVLGAYVPTVMMVLLGGYLGATLLGAYLFFALNVLKIHRNEAFSALAVDRYKHFLRFRITAKGLALAVIAVPHVADTGDQPAVHLVECVGWSAGRVEVLGVEGFRRLFGAQAPPIETQSD